MKQWRVSASSVQGVSHIKTNQPCQDANEWRIENGLLFAAIADGAGSAKESQRGATLACRVALDELVKSFNGSSAGRFDSQHSESFKKAFTVAREAIIAEAQASKLPIRELSCTLILVAGCEQGAIAAQIGDGATLLLSAKGELQALTKPADSEYLNETVFITADEALSQLQIQSYSGEVKSLVMFTDGLQMLALKMPDAQPHSPFILPLIKYIEGESDDVRRQEQLQKFLTSSRITERADDDLTLLLATVV